MIVPISSSKDPRVLGLLRLAHLLFPPALIEPDAQLLAEMDGKGHLPYRYSVWEEDGVVGFVRFASLSFGPKYVVHLGVDPDRQGRGIGGALLRSVGVETILLEVGNGREIVWWRRHGAETLTPTYTQPSLRPETPPCPLNLMAIGHVVDTRQTVEAFYREVWQRPGDDPLVRLAVAGVGK